MIREGDIGEKLFPDFPDMKVDFAEIGIGKIGKIGLAPPPHFLPLVVFEIRHFRHTENKYLSFDAISDPTKFKDDWRRLEVGKFRRGPQIL